MDGQEQVDFAVDENTMTDEQDKKVKFTPTYNIGHIAIVVGLVLNVLVVGVPQLVNLSNATAAAKEIEVMKPIQQQHTFQIEQLQSQNTENKGQLSTILSTVNKISEDVAVIKAREPSGSAR